MRVSTGLLGLAPTLTRSPLQVLARLHTLAAAGSVDDSELGRPRDAGAAERLQGVARLLSGPATVPALLLAAVVHADLATTAPFASHNGLVARAAERLVLVARGVDEKSLTVPEAAHLALRAEYESNLRAYRDGGPNGVHAWLLYAAEAYAAAAEASPLRRDAGLAENGLLHKAETASEEAAHHLLKILSSGLRFQGLVSPPNRRRHGVQQLQSHT